MLPLQAFSDHPISTITSSSVWFPWYPSLLEMTLFIGFHTVGCLPSPTGRWIPWEHGPSSSPSQPLYLEECPPIADAHSTFVKREKDQNGKEIQINRCNNENLCWWQWWQDKISSILCFNLYIVDVILHNWFMMRTDKCWDKLCIFLLFI